MDAAPTPTPEEPKGRVFSSRRLLIVGAAFVLLALGLYTGFLWCLWSAQYELCLPRSTDLLWGYLWLVLPLVWTLLLPRRATRTARFLVVIMVIIAGLCLECAGLAFFARKGDDPTLRAAYWLAGFTATANVASTVLLMAWLLPLVRTKPSRGPRPTAVER